MFTDMDDEMTNEAFARMRDTMGMLVAIQGCFRALKLLETRPAVMMKVMDGLKTESMCIPKNFEGYINTVRGGTAKADVLCKKAPPATLPDNASPMVSVTASSASSASAHAERDVAEPGPGAQVGNTDPQLDGETKRRRTLKKTVA
jgi:hypothetical protein